MANKKNSNFEIRNCEILLCELCVSGGENEFGYITAEALKTPRRGSQNVDLTKPSVALCVLCGKILLFVLLIAALPPVPRR